MDRNVRTEVTEANKARASDMAKSMKVCVSGILSLKRVQALQFIREEEVASLVAKLRRLVNDDRGARVNLSDLFLTLASTTLSRSVLGLKSADESIRVMGQLAQQASNLLGEVTAVGDYIPALSWVDHLRGLTRETKRVSRAVHEFLDRVIDEHIEKQNDGDDDDRKYFVDILLELQAKKDVIGGHELSRKEIRAVLLTLFIAGIESSATTLECTMKEIVKNPRIMRKLQEEIRGVVGNKSNIHQSDLNQMEYLKCVIKETLRLHSAKLLARQASEDVDVGGFRIPAKGVGLINMWAIHRDPDTWDRPLEYLPERFVDASYDYTGQDQKYFPFGLGRRICPGVQFAMFSIEYALANVLCWFDWELPDGMSARDFDMSAVPLHLVPVQPSHGSL
uniref:Cytochrome P450 n=1 Tax=Kalanchoe fedtschenkoi TaxID=63787 RepID=A0A7N0VA52_KALFE